MRVRITIQTARGETEFEKRRPDDLRLMDIDNEPKSVRSLLTAVMEQAFLAYPDQAQE